MFGGASASAAAAGASARGLWSGLAGRVGGEE